MIKKIGYLVFAIVCLSMVFGAAQFAFAQSNPPRGSNPIIITFVPNFFGCQQIDCVVQKILEALVKIATPFVVIMILIGAFQIITAGGDPEKFKSGRKTILYTVIGYAIILLASSVVPIVKSILGTT